MTAGIGARFNIKLVICVFKTKVLCYKNLKCASGHLLYAQLRTLGGYLSTNMGVFSFVIHTACYCLGAIDLSGNVWIKCLYAKVRR